MKERIVRKSLSNLSTSEIQELKSLSHPGGAFRVILSNLENGKIARADDIDIALLVNIEAGITGWLFIDPAREYNELLPEGSVSLMIYIHKDWRGCGRAKNLLISQRSTFLNKSLVFYISKKAKPAFRKIEKDTGIKFIFKEPILYLKRK